MLGVDHDKIILRANPFPTIPMLGTNCWCNVIVFYVGNKRCCTVSILIISTPRVSVHDRYYCIIIIEFSISLVVLFVEDTLTIPFNDHISVDFEDFSNCLVTDYNSHGYCRWTQCNMLSNFD